MKDRSRLRSGLRRAGIAAGVLVAVVFVASLLLSRSDGPVFVFAGGPLRSGELIDFADMDWSAVDDLHELELEIVGAESSRILWFSVDRGAPYVACDLDCVGGVLARWPQQIERDDRVVVRIEDKRIEARLVHVLHGSAEYEEASARRKAKYSGAGGGRAAAETAAHSAVVDVGETLTGRSRRDEPGDRLYRIAPREP